MPFINPLSSTVALTLIVAHMGGCGPKSPGESETGASNSSGGLTASNSSMETSNALPTTTATDSTTTPTSGMSEGNSNSGSATGSDESGSGETGMGVCDDSNAPPSCACNDRGNPQGTFGLTWNFNGEPGDPGAEFEMRCIVPETGETQLIAAVPEIGKNPHAFDYDGQGILHVLANTGLPENVLKLFSIDTSSGAVVDSPEVEIPPQFSSWDSLHVRSDGVLVGLRENSMMDLELLTLDSKTGQTTLINSIPDVESANATTRAYDKVDDRIYTIAVLKDKKAHLLVIDAMDGTLVGSPELKDELAWFSFYVRNDQQLIGVVHKGLFSLDPVTGEGSEIAQIPDFKALIYFASTYDPVENRVIFVDVDSRVRQIDASSGEVISTAQIPLSQSNLTLNWRGGIHVR